MEQLFIKLRGVIFAEAGYCLEAPALTKESTAFFATLNQKGHTIQVDRILGCEGDAEDASIVRLTPYPNREQALKWLHVMCMALDLAVKGDLQARAMLCYGWLSMVREGLMCEQQDQETQHRLTCHLFGAGRVLDELNRKGTFRYFPKPDWEALLDEALHSRAAQEAA